MVATYTAKTHVFNSQAVSDRLKRKRDEAYRVLFVETNAATKKKMAQRVLDELKKNPAASPHTADILYASLHLTNFNPRELADLAAHNAEVKNLILSNIALLPEKKASAIEINLPANIVDENAADHALSQNATQARARLQKLFTHDAHFAYQFFADWKLTAEDIASLDPMVLRSIAVTNPGAALGMLINPALTSTLEGALFESETIKQNNAKIEKLKDQIFHLSQRIKEIHDKSPKVGGEHQISEIDKNVILDLNRQLQKQQTELNELKALIDSEKKQVAFMLVNAANQSQENQRHYFPVTLDLMLSSFKSENKQYVVNVLKEALGNNTDSNNPIRDLFEKEIRPDLGRVMEKHFDVFVELARDPYQNNLSKLLFHSADPINLLGRLLEYAKSEKALFSTITDQIGSILTTFAAKKSGKEYKNSSLEEMIRLARPLVVNLISAYAENKTPQRADQIAQLFMQTDLIEALKLSDETLRKVSQDGNFLNKFSLASLESSSRKEHWFKSWLNQQFNVFATDFVRPVFKDLKLSLTEKKPHPHGILSPERLRDTDNVLFPKDIAYEPKLKTVGKLSSQKVNEVKTALVQSKERFLQIVLVNATSNQTKQRPLINLSWKQFQKLQAALERSPRLKARLNKMFPGAFPQNSQAILAIEGAQQPAKKTQATATPKTIASALSAVIVNPRKPLSAPTLRTTTTIEKEEVVVSVEKTTKVEKPEAPVTPEKVQKPAAPVTPEQVQKPAAPKTPEEESISISRPDRIEEPVTPVKKPDAPATPEMQKPEAPVTPVSNKPAAPITPVATKPTAPFTPPTASGKPIAPETPEDSQDKIKRLLAQPGIRVEEPETPVQKPEAPITPEEAKPTAPITPPSSKKSSRKLTAPITPPQSGRKEKPIAPKTPYSDENTQPQYGLSGKSPTVKSNVVRDIFGVKARTQPFTIVK